MNDRRDSAGAQIRLDPQTQRLMLVDQEGKPVPAIQRKEYIERMTLDELRALVEALFDLRIG
jgi:hypothetical protein